MARSAPPPVPPPGTLRLKLVNGLTRSNVALFRLTRGRLGGRVAGAPVLLLNHVGRKSGQKRTTPLLYLDDGDRLVIVASRGGSHATPAWWLNLQAEPRVTVELRGDRREVVARLATPEERAELWPRLNAMYSDYETYQGRTSREIPVVLLEPSSPRL